MVSCCDEQRGETKRSERAVTRAKHGAERAPRDENLPKQESEACPSPPRRRKSRLCFASLPAPVPCPELPQSTEQPGCWIGLLDRARPPCTTRTRSGAAPPRARCLRGRGKGRGRSWGVLPFRISLLRALSALCVCRQRQKSLRGAQGHRSPTVAWRWG